MVSASRRIHVAIACLVLVGSGTAFAETIFQLNGYSVSNSGSGNAQTLTWNRFDPALGVLTGVSLTIGGTSSGSITVTNSDPDPIDLFNFVNRVRLTFGGTGQPGNQTTSNTAITTSPLIPTSPSFFELDGESSQVFTLTSSQTLAGLSSDLSSFLAYFTGLDTFPTSVFQLPVVGTSDSNATTVNSSSLATGGSVGLTYTYTPNAPVPEIDPAGMGSVLALMTGAFGLLERRRLRGGRRR